MEERFNQRHFEAGNYFQFSRKVRKEFEEWASVGDKFRLLQFNSSSLSLSKMLLLILQPFVFVFVKVTTIRSRWIWKFLSRPLVRLRNDKVGRSVRYSIVCCRCSVGKQSNLFCHIRTKICLEMTPNRTPKKPFEDDQYLFCFN